MSSPQLPIFLDHHSTTPVDSRVLEKMLPYFTEHYGNAASRTHVFGMKANEAVEEARGLVAALIGASPKEIIFTSGATESINIALKGVARGNSARGKHIVTCATEHKAVLDTCGSLEREGFSVSYLPVLSDGMIDLEQLKVELRPDTILVTFMMANNEIGVIHPVSEIGAILSKRNILFHVDAAQACGRIPIDVQRDGVHLLSISGHKLYGPKGTGALYVRRRGMQIRMEPIIHGGGHERGLRSGTLNVPGIVGLGEACRIAGLEMTAEAERTSALRDHLLSRLREGITGIHVNGSMSNRLPNNLNVSFDRVEGESLIMSLRDVAVSSGSACTSASVTPSHVLSALGLSADIIHSSIRFGLGRHTTLEEINYAADRVIASVESLRGLGLG